MTTEDRLNRLEEKNATRRLSGEPLWTKRDVLSFALSEVRRAKGELAEAVFWALTKNPVPPAVGEIVEKLRSESRGEQVG